MAAQLLGQPNHTAPLPFEFGFNEVSDMRFVACGHVVVIWVQKKRGIDSLLDSRVSTPTLLTSIPRRNNYGICNLSLKSCPRQTGTCGKLRVKDSNKCYLLICLYLFVYSFVFKLLIIIVLIIDIFIQICAQIRTIFVQRLLHHLLGDEFAAIFGHHGNCTISFCPSLFSICAIGNCTNSSNFKCSPR